MTLKTFIEKTNENIAKHKDDLRARFIGYSVFPKEIPSDFWVRTKRNEITVKSSSGRSGYAFALTVRMRRIGPSYKTRMVADRVEVNPNYKSKLDMEMADIYAEARKASEAYNAKEKAEGASKKAAFDAKLASYGMDFDAYLALRRLAREAGL